MSILKHEKNMWVKLVAPRGFYKRHAGAILKVVFKRIGKYDVDITPLGYPGRTRGWLYRNEVEELTL
jgi:hypothetical protein